MEEVRYALFQIGPAKALGPNGMSAIFFQTFWNIVGCDKFNLVSKFFLHYGVLPDGINHSTIVLIHKIKDRKRVSNIQPIFV